jgi:hypothetical protein
MKISEEENIDKLFKRLEDHVMEPDLAQLEEMKIKLEGMKYHQFGWRHFNIFYSGLIGLSVLLSAWAVTDRFIDRGGNTNIIAADTVYIRDTVFIISRGVPDTKTDKPIEGRGPDKKSLASSVNEHPQEAKRSLDSILDAPPTTIPSYGTNPPVSITPSPDSVKLKKTIKPRKIIYINKKDTIIKYDTTKVLRKK